MKEVIDKIALPSGRIVEYIIRRSKKARRERLTMYEDGQLVAVIPWSRSFSSGSSLITEKISWIERNVKQFEKTPRISLPKVSKQDLPEYLKKARLIVEERVSFFNQYYGYRFNKIFVKNHSAQWGSCSSNKNLNFNYKLMFLPDKLIDYIVVHEICHLKQLNHSKKFWDLIEETIPDFKERESLLSLYIVRH